MTQNTKTTVTIKIDKQLKEDTQEILNSLGLDFSKAINIYFRQIVMRQGLPFKVQITGQWDDPDEQNEQNEEI